MRTILAALLGVAALMGQTVPARARRAFEAGLKAAEAGRRTEARNAYRQAIETYPGYAEAWCELGIVEMLDGEPDAARKSFGKAIESDPKFGKPRLWLARLEQQAGNWSALIAASSALIELQSADQPEALLLNAAGRYETGDLDGAERSALAAEKADAAGRLLKIHELLGWVWVRRGNSATGMDRFRAYASAADRFHTYLQRAAPDSHTAELRATLSDLEKRLGAGPSESAPETGVVLRTTTRLVEVHTVARDATGRLVTDLTKPEFSLFDEGKPQPVATFEKGAPASAAVPAVDSQTFRNEVPVSGRRGYTVVLVDWLNSQIRTTQRARQVAMQVVRELDSSADLALYSLGRDGLKLVDEFGASRAGLLQHLATLAGPHSPCAGMALDGQDRSKCDDPLMPERLAEVYFEERINDTIAALESLGHHLAGIAGRKAVIWITSGIPLAVAHKPYGTGVFTEPQAGIDSMGGAADRMLRTLSDADVALYPIDARGLHSAPLPSDDLNGYQVTTPTMDLFAERTGGLAFHGRNNLELGMRNAFEDGRATYTLGYYAPREAGSGFRHIEVRVLRPGVKLNHRQGYFADDSAQAPEQRNAQLAQAMRSPLEATAISIRASIEPHGDRVTLRLLLDISRLDLQAKGSGWAGAIDLAVRFASDSTEQNFSTDGERIDLNLSQAAWDAAAARGYPIERTFPPPAGAQRLRVVVRSVQSGALGSITVPLPGR